MLLRPARYGPLGTLVFLLAFSESMSSAKSRDRVYEFGPYRLEVGERRLLHAGESVALRPKVFDTLLLLVENSGHLVEKEQMLAALWPDTLVEETNLTHNVSVLRKTPGSLPDQAEVEYIETIPRRGYRFTTPVRTVNRSPAPLGSGDEIAVSPARRRARAAASIAVLPFTNISSDKDQEYFCDGMAEELIDALTQVSGLRVVARTSSFQFKGKNLDAREVAQSLDVSTLLEGSVRRVGDRLRITAQLIQAADGYHLWSQSYDRQLSDVFEIQEEIATSIVERLEYELLGSRRVGAARSAKVDMDAYNLFMEARHHFSAETGAGIERAIELLERVIELEPESAPAWAYLARSYPTLSGYGLLPAEQALPRAERAAQRALELDESLSDAHLASGTIRAWLHMDWLGAQRCYLRSLELRPGSAEAHHAYVTLFLAPVGRLEEAEKHARIALDLDPLSAMRSRVLAQILFWSRQYDAAASQLLHALELDPQLMLGHQLLAAVYTSMGRADDSLEQRQLHLRQLGRASVADEIGLVYERGGEPALFRWLLARALKRAESGPAGAYNLALLHGWLGETEEALSWLDRAARQKGDMVVYAKVHPWLDRLRPDPRFDQILDRMGVNDPRVTRAGARPTVE